MKNLLVFTLAFCISALAFAQESGKKYVKTVDAQSSQFITFETEYPVEAVEWAESKVRVLVDVKLKNANDKILEQLMLAGRYKISTRKEGEKFILDIPGLKKEVVLKGQKLEEDVKILLFVPEYTSVNSKSLDGGLTDISVERGVNRELAERGLAAKGDPFFDSFDVEFNFSTTDAMAKPSVSDLEAKRNGIDEKIKQLQKEKALLEAEIEKLKGN